MFANIFVCVLNVYCVFTRRECIPGDTHFCRANKRSLTNLRTLGLPMYCYFVSASLLFQALDIWHLATPDKYLYNECRATQPSQ